MKRLAILCVFVSSFGAAFAQTQDVKDALHKIYDKIETAYNKGDADAIIAPLSADYEWKMMDGKTLNLKDAKKDIKSELASVQSGKWHVDIISSLGGSSSVMVTVQYSFKGQMVDSSKVPYNAELTSTERQTWIKLSTGWVQTKDEILGVKSKSDFQKVDPTIAVSESSSGGK